MTAACATKPRHYNSGTCAYRSFKYVLPSIDREKTIRIIFLDKKAPMIIPWLYTWLKYLQMLQNKRVFFIIVFVRIPTSNIMFSAQFEELSWINWHHLNSIFYTSSPVSCFTEALCKTAVPVGCPVLFFLVQALKEKNVSTIKTWLKQACYLTYSLRLIIPRRISFSRSGVVRSSLIRRRISVCSCKEFFTSASTKC